MDGNGKQMDSSVLLSAKKPGAQTARPKATPIDSPPTNLSK
jgi:hypothetical protein